MEFNEMVETIKAGEQLEVSPKGYPELRKSLSVYAAFIKEADAPLFMAVVREIQRLDLVYKTGAYQEDKWFDCVFADDYFSIMMIPGGLMGLAMRKIFITIHFLPYEWESLRQSMKAIEASRLEAKPNDNMKIIKLEIPNRRFAVDLLKDEYFAFLKLLETCSVEYIQEKYQEVLGAKFDEKHPVHIG